MNNLTSAKIKHQYTSPKIIKLGNVKRKTLGNNLYSTDNNSNAAACRNNGGGIPCAS